MAGRTAVHLVLLGLVSLGAAVVAVPINGSESESSSSAGLHGSFCHTTGCNGTAAYLEKDMDPTADPCANFYQFACGGYVRDTKLESHQHSRSIMEDMVERVQLQLRTILEAPDKGNDLMAFNQTRAFYQSCMDTARLEELGVEPAMKIISKLGGWPVLEGDRWNESQFNLTKMLFLMKREKLHGHYLFKLEVVPVISRNGPTYAMELSMADLYLDLKGYDDAAASKRYEDYANLTAEVAFLLGGTNINKSRVVEEMRQMASFELELNTHTMTLEERHRLGGGSLELTIDILQWYNSSLPWLEYIRFMMDDETIGLQQELLVDVAYVEELDRMLRNTTKRTLANYLVWRALRKHALPYLTEDARRLVTEHDTRRPIAGRERWKDCVDLTQVRLPQATSAMYAHHFTSLKLVQDARATVAHVIEEMAKVIGEADWMSPSAKSSAKLKVKKIRSVVGYISKLTNRTLLEEFYQHIDLRNKSFLEKNLILTDAEERLKNEKLNVAVATPLDWDSPTAKADAVNAFYSQGHNTIGIPIGILQGSVFDVDRPQYMNYGGVGYVVGHEVSHGFDERGSMVTPNGTVDLWWDESTHNSFQLKVLCIIEQYSNMTDKETNLTINGFLSQSENIADSAGVKLAYRAYKRQVTSTEPRIGLRFPNTTLALSPQQMFWINFANFHCEKSTLEYKEKTLRIAPHLPGEHRVNGVVRNQEDFAADFSCPTGSPMNPPTKCRVW